MREKLRSASNLFLFFFIFFFFFCQRNISADFHCNSFESLPAHIDAPPPVSSLVFAACKIGSTVLDDYIRLLRSCPPLRNSVFMDFRAGRQTDRR